MNKCIIHSCIGDSRVGRVGMFLNRLAELARLQRWWDGGEVELITLYGRRQVGSQYSSAGRAGWSGRLY